MKKILKRNQIIIFVIALMLVAAGYLSYQGDGSSLDASTYLSDSEEYSAIGDARLVNGEISTNNENSNSSEKEENTDGELETGIVSNNEDGSITTNSTTEANSEQKANNKENEDDSAVNTSSSVNSESNTEYFASSRLGRDTMYSQMSDNYQKILDNTNTTEAQKSVATEEIKSINDIKNAIMICENLIKSKGFEDVIVFVNDNSINVVVKKDSLTAEEVAQIQNIVSRELEADLSNIHISNKP